MLVKYLLRYDKEKLGFVFEGRSIDDVGKFEELFGFEVATDLGEEFVSRVDNRVVFYRVPVIPVDYVFLEREERGWFFFYPAISCINVKEICGIEFGRDKLEVISVLVAGCVNFRMRMGEFYKVVLGVNGEDWEIYWSRGSSSEKGVCVSEEDLPVSSFTVEVSEVTGESQESQEEVRFQRDVQQKEYIELGIDLPFGGEDSKRETGASNFQNRRQVTEKQRKYLKDLLRSRMGVSESLADAFVDRIDRRKASEVIDLLKEGKIDIVKKEIMDLCNVSITDDLQFQDENWQDEVNEGIDERIIDEGVEDGGIGYDFEGEV